MITRTISITDMKKENEHQVTEILHDVWGVRNVKLNPEKGEATISFDEKAGSLMDFTQALIDSGFEVNVEDSQ